MQEEMTVRDLFLKIGDHIKELKKSYWLLLVFMILFVGGMLVKHFIKPKLYPAKLTFMVNEEEGNSGFSGVLGRFGIGSPGEFNLEKITELAKSRKIISEALFYNQKNYNHDFLANEIITEYELDKKWSENWSTLSGFTFTHDVIDSFSRIENRALKFLHNFIIGSGSNNPLTKISYEETTGILNISTNSTSERLSINFTNALYDVLSEFYIKKTIGKYERTYELLNAKVDSLERMLNLKNLELLHFEDSNRKLSLKKYQAKKIILQGEITKFANSYGEAFKSLELAEFSLKNETPVVVTIDKPIAPIVPQQNSILKTIIIGSFLGFFFGTAFIISRKLVYDIINDNV